MSKTAVVVLAVSGVLIAFQARRGETGTLETGTLETESFVPETEVGDGAGMVVQASLAIDVVNAHVTSVIGDKIYHRVYNSRTTEGAFITPDQTAGQGDPDSVASNLGQVFVIYTQEDTDGGVGREIIESRLAGPSFLDPENRSNNPNDEQSPQVARDRNGIFHAVWSRTNGETTEVVYYTSRFGGSTTVVAEGESPRIAVDEGIFVHLMYVRDGELLYQNNSSGGFATENEVTVDSGQIFNTSIGVSAAGKVFATYETQGRLVLRTSTGGAFDPSRDVATGGVSGSSLFVSTDARATMTYSLLGDIYVAFDSSSDTPDTIQVTSTVGIETAPDVQVNLQTGVIHLIYLRDDRVYYTNNTPSPVAAIEADPLVGDVPLQVTFEDRSTGQIHTREWEFGDGEFSDEANPTHVYETAGDYTATLRVFGPGGMDETSLVISVRSKVDFMIVPPITTFVGHTDLIVPIQGTYKLPASAFSITGRWDPSVLSIVDISIENTFTAGSSPSVFNWFADESIPGEEIFFVAVIISLPDPDSGESDREVLPTGTKVRLVNVIVEIRDDIAPQDGLFLEVEDGVGGGDTSNLFTAVPQIATRPGLINHPMNIRSEEDYDALSQILRGDVNQSTNINITDAINMLVFLFLGQFSLTCQDLADVDDNGAINVSDALSLLIFLFVGGEPPKPPWPQVGPDPTADTLQEENCGQ